MESKLVAFQLLALEKNKNNFETRTGKFGSHNLGEMKKTLNCCPPVTFKRME